MSDPDKDWHREIHGTRTGRITSKKSNIEEIPKVYNENAPPEGVISSHLLDLVDNYISTRAQRLAADKEAASIKEIEDDLKKTIIAKYREQGLKALGARNGTVKMNTAMKPKIRDWTELWAHIQETGEFELLHKRLTESAVEERWEAGELVPGVGSEEVVNLSVSK
jgi:hypothetical protein